jgi:tripartite-type tricarboxylate transporter receptor subunit TctC
MRRSLGFAVASCVALCFAALLALGMHEVCAQGSVPGNVPANVSTNAPGADYPNHSITFIVGFAPGGGIDTFARVVAQELSEAGFSVVIENRAGAASNIAARAVAAAVPDGYTLLFTGNSYAINQTLYRNPGYATEDLRPVAFVAIDSMALAVNAANAERSLGEFLAARKAMPFNFGFGGSSARIGAEYVFKVLAKANATGVPFQSGAPALNALLGKHVDIIMAPVAEVHPQIAQGAVRALAVTGPRRAGSLPDVPTLDELGMPGLGINGWIGILAPAKTPTEICARLNVAVNQIVAKPNVDKRLRGLGYEPYIGALTDAGGFLKRQIDTWGDLIRATGISAD